jgi:hypothetical protein
LFSKSHSIQLKSASLWGSRMVSISKIRTDILWKSYE